MRYIPYQQAPIYNYSPYQNAPTIGSIGGYGYQQYPQYQTGYYNQYFNPYYLRQQQEAQRRLEIQEANNQADIWSRLINCRNSFFGYEESKEDIINQIRDRAVIQQQMDSDEQFMNSIHQISQATQQKKAEAKAMQDNIERQREVMQEQEPQEVKSLYQWLKEDGSRRYRESQYAEMYKQQRNVSKLYDSSAYNNLLSTHDSVFSSYNALNRNVNIDDMEIQVNLPEHLRRERDIRRQRFAESLKKGMI